MPLARLWLCYRRCYRLRYRRCYEWLRMTPARRAFRECRMQFPDTVSHRATILLELQRLRTLLKVHSIELHAKLLRARGADGMRGGVAAPWRDLTASKRGELRH